MMKCVRGVGAIEVVLSPKERGKSQKESDAPT
jgi:hypothetical protein